MGPAEDITWIMKYIKWEWKQYKLLDTHYAHELLKPYQIVPALVVHCYYSDLSTHLACSKLLLQAVNTISIGQENLLIKRVSKRDSVLE